MDEINNEEKQPEALQPVVESLEPTVESLNDSAVETIDNSASVVPAVTSEPSTEVQTGFIEINSETTTEAPAAVEAPEVIKSVETAEAVPVVEPTSEATTEASTAVKEEPPKALETKSKENKKINPILIIVILLLIAVGVVAGFFIAKSLGDKEINDAGSTGNPSNVNSVSIDKVVYSGLTFDIPKSYSVTIEDNMLSIEDDNGINYAITVDERSYTNIKSNKDLFKKNFESNGYTTKEFEEKNIDGSQYLYLDINNGTNIRTFFRSIDTTSTFIGVIIRADNGAITDSDLSTIEKILATARVDAGGRAINGDEGTSTSYEDIMNILRDRGTLADEVIPSEETPAPEPEVNPEPVVDENPGVEEPAPTE